MNIVEMQFAFSADYSKTNWAFFIPSDSIKLPSDINLRKTPKIIYLCVKPGAGKFFRLINPIPNPEDKTKLL